MRFLLLEDDFEYRQTIKEYLESLEYQIDDFDNGEDAYNAIYEKSYQLLILDIRVPKLSGYDLVKKLRASNNNTPVIYITSLTDINNLSLGYELGCNDYIKKPFSPKELRYRIEQLIKLVYSKENQEMISLNNGFKYNILNSELFNNKVQVNLTKKEKELLFCLVSHKNQFVSINQLRVEVWDDKYINESDIRISVKKIRDKTTKELITTQRGLGYKIDRK
jgi:DNA-binding response OmpR family regulator